MALVPAASTALARLGGTALASAAGAASGADGLTSGAVTAACCLVGAGYAIGSSIAKRRRLDRELGEVREQNQRLTTELAGVLGRVEQMQSQVNEMSSKVGGVQHQVGNVQGQVSGMQEQVGGMQGRVQEVHGEVGEMRGQIDGVSQAVGQVGRLHEQVGDVRGQVTELAHAEAVTRDSVHRLRGESQALAAHMGQSVRHALRDSMDAVVGNVNQALERRRFGMGPRVQEVEVEFVPNVVPALAQG